MSRYLNPSQQGEKVRALLTIVPSGADSDKQRVRKRILRRLPDNQLQQLLDGYRSGVPVAQLAAQFKIHKSTVVEAAKRNGLKLRYPALTSKEVAEARALYESGQSVATVAKHFEVAPRTIWSTLKKAGVQIRPRNGWKA